MKMECKVHTSSIGDEIEIARLAILKFKLRRYPSRDLISGPTTGAGQDT